MSHIAKGFIAAAILITFHVAGIFLRYSDKIWSVPVMGCLLMALVIFGCILFSKQAKDPVTFNLVFTHGFKMTAVVTCIFFVYILLAINVLFPSMVDQMVQTAIDEAKKDRNYSEDYVKQNMEKAKSVAKVMISAGSVLAVMVVGVIGDLIGSMVAQNISRSSSQITK